MRLHECVDILHFMTWKLKALYGRINVYFMGEHISVYGLNLVQPFFTTWQEYRGRRGREKRERERGWGKRWRCHIAKLWRAGTNMQSISLPSGSRGHVSHHLSRARWPHKPNNRIKDTVLFDFWSRYYRDEDGVWNEYCMHCLCLISNSSSKRELRYWYVHIIRQWVRTAQRNLCVSWSYHASMSYFTVL